MVWVYDKERPGPRAQPPINTAVETHFHTLTLTDGTRTDVLEQELAKIEGAAKPILERWQERNATPTADEIEEIAYFFGAMHCRVRRHVEGVREALEEIGRWLLERHGKDPETMRAFYARVGQDHPEVRVPTLEATRAALADPKRQFLIRENEKIALGLALMDTPMTIGKHLRTMNWCLCRAVRDALFVTSDAPLNVFLEHGDMASFDTGLAEPGVDVAFPVSPEVCVRINRSGAVARREVSEDVVDQINRRIVLAAQQFVIASVKSESLEALVREFAVTRAWPKWKPGSWRARLDAMFPDLAP